MNLAGAISIVIGLVNLANIGHDLNAYSKGRFTLGLGSQIKPHITKRFSMQWGAPADQMRELVLAMRRNNERLVQAAEDKMMPFEPHCRDSLNVEHAELLYDGRDTVVECSRLAVDTTFRRRFGEDHTRLGEYNALDCCHLEQPRFGPTVQRALRF